MNRPRPAGEDSLTDAATLLAGLVNRDPSRATEDEICQVRAAEALRSALDTARGWLGRTERPVGRLLTVTYADGSWSLRLDGTLVADHGGLPPTQPAATRVWAEETVARLGGRAMGWRARRDGAQVALVIPDEPDKETTS